MKGLFRHRADAFQDRAAVQPSLVWIWPCSNNAQDAFCESCKSMIRLESWSVVGYNEDVHCMTHTLFPVHQLLQFKCFETACKNSMKAALICLTLLLLCASSGTGGVEKWGWDEHFAMWQCSARCYQKLFQHVKYLSPVVLSLPFSCFEVMSHSWWISIVLLPGIHLNLSRSDSHDFWFAVKRPHTWKALLLSHKVVVSSFSSDWFQMATLCRASHKGDGQRYVRRCVDNHAAVPRAKVRKLLCKSLTNQHPPSARQT